MGQVGDRGQFVVGGEREEELGGGDGEAVGAVVTCVSSFHHFIILRLELTILFCRFVGLGGGLGGCVVGWWR